MLYMIQKIEIGYWSLNWGQFPFDKHPTLLFAEWDYFLPHTNVKFCVVLKKSAWCLSFNI